MNEFSDNESKDDGEEIYALKQQIKSQQKHIARLQHQIREIIGEPVFAPSKIYTLFCGYSAEYFHHGYEDIVKLLIFHYELLLKRSIVQQDLNQINWRNLKLFKSESLDIDSMNKSVTITQEAIKEYCCIALELLNNSNENVNDKNNDLVPIAVKAKHDNYYGIEWVLIVRIIHANSNVGISFKYNGRSNEFIATSIYLSKREIESKHQFIGLQIDYSRHLRPFNLKGLEFITDQSSISDDEELYF